ncbi:HDOD domain-containing protein [Aquabacterium lacunae]|uniref:HDOD domain-containing protein n=1 Tax=Aquabacterium lacunae TaxID=2528630 RepID=A0A4Q9GWN3_9BURK|nr:HDOD domain-containing protein [Aquabacterium lacunae]TBO28806.1 HDOD domain-containing protein [Aquabacterium lacunae]
MAAVPSSAGTSTRRFGRFELRQLVGKSAASNTWLAFDTALQGEVLLCVPRVAPANATQRENWTQDLLLASRLKHPRLIEIVDMGVHEGWPFVVHERKGMLTLSERLQPGQGHLTVTESVQVIIDLMDGLAYAHEAGVSHRDVALHNVVFDAGGKACWIGLSAGIAAPPPGSPPPLPGRQMQREQSERDLLMVGLLLHRLLAGHPALDDGDLGHAASRVGLEIVRLPFTLAQPVPDTLRAIVNRATDRQQRQRYLKARTLLSALQGWLKAHSQESNGPLALLMDRLQSVGHLPSRDEDLQPLQQVLVSETLRVDDIVDRLVLDPAVCWEVLRVINHLRQRAGRTEESITSLSRGLTLLGQQGVRKLCAGVRAWPGALGAQVSLQGATTSAQSLKTLSDELKMCCIGGITARWLRPFNVGDEEVLLAAMAQRLGKLLIYYHFPDEAAQILKLMQPGPPAEEGGKPTPGMAFEAAVGAVLGIHPDELTTAVMNYWGLSDALVQAARPIGLSNAPRRPENPDDWLRVTASLANELCLLIGQPHQRQAALLQHILGRYARPAAVTQQEVLDALNRAVERVEPAWKAGVMPARSASRSAEPAVARG